MIPVFGNDWKVWARKLSAELNAAPLQLRYKDADSSAAVDGVLMWDPDAQEVVVSVGGAWVGVADGGGP